LVNTGKVEPFSCSVKENWVNIRLIPLALSVVFLVCPPGFAQEDNVLATIEEAVKQYEGGDYAGAASNLDYASQLVRQKRSEATKELLPDALPGWTASEAQAQAVAAGVLGGGVTVSRDYKKGGAVVSIEIVSDSPVLQSVLMMINNPLFAGAGGGKLERVGQQRAVVKFDSVDRSGEMYIVIDNQFLVTVSGRGIDRADLLTYAGAIDFKALSQN
jgi:hypothetical protein